MASESVVEALGAYRRQVAGRYRAIKPSELDDLPPGEAWLSPKIDGELAGIELHAGKASAFTRGGREVPDSPLLKELRAAAAKAKVPVRIVGELHCRPEGDARPRVGDVSAALSGNRALLGRLSFAGFDLLPSGDDALPADHGLRLDAIRAALDGLKAAFAVETVRTADRAEVRGAWQDWGASGKSEGMIARTADGRVFKVKPDLSVDAVVMAFTTRCDAPGQVRSLLLGLARDDGTFQLVGGLGNAGSASQREELHATLTKLECPSALRQPSSDGGIYRFVRPVTVAEVGCTDVQAEDSSGDPVRRWALRFDGSGWHGIAMAAGVSLLHPQFVRLRADKQATAADAGFAQVAQRCTVPAADSTERSGAAPANVAVRRVWTKATKGKVAVRKLLVWSTGHPAGDEWPAWAVHFTDYSPDRKTPLERTFRSARTRQEADAAAEALVEENIKKGWSEVK